MDLLKVFGCLCYAHNKPRQKDKFGPRSRKCVFLGYPFGKKGWRVFDLETQQIFVSRDVRFMEDVFPFATNSQTDQPPLSCDMEYADLEFGIFDHPEYTTPVPATITSPSDDDRGSLSHSTPPAQPPDSAPIVYSRRTRTKQPANNTRQQGQQPGTSPMPSVRLLNDETVLAESPSSFATPSSPREPEASTLLMMLQHHDSAALHRGIQTTFVTRLVIHTPSPLHPIHRQPQVRGSL